MSEIQEPRSNLPEDAEAKVEELAERYLDELQAGQTPDRQAFVAEHPEIADALERRLALVELMYRTARKVSSVAALEQPGRAGGEPAVRIKCPHCGNRIQLVETEPQEVTCQNCGSSFQVDPRATTPYPPGGLPKSIGKFEVVELLGRGAFGMVYKACDPELARTVAVKVPRAGYFNTQEEEERFLREARSTAQLHHPSIVQVHEIGHEKNVPYIVSDYVEGLTLADVLTGRRPGFRESAELVAQIADALEYAHRAKVIHRDIKPSNILIDAEGRPHITDFGLARRDEGEITVTLDGQILGTPAYMSPEQAAGDRQRVDARSDVYSLGVVLYELLTGELPFRGNKRMLLHQVLHEDPRPPRSLSDRIPRDLETICLKALAKEPGRRYSSAAEMAEDLRRYLRGDAIRARPPSALERLRRWGKRRHGAALVLAGIIAGIVLTWIIFALRPSQLSSHDEDKSKGDPLLLAAKTRSQNNLRRLAMAMLQYQDTYKRLPPAVVRSKEGRPLYSWRVLLLPFVEETSLYEHFHLDEPWDSPHNWEFLARMPDIYAPVLDRGKHPDSTFYQVFVGGGAFGGKEPIRIPEHFPDGTSKTFMIVEAGEAVPWTRPVDLNYDPNGPLPKLGGLFEDGFNAAMVDSSVQFVSRKPTPEKIIRAYITPAGRDNLDPLP